MSLQSLLDPNLDPNTQQDSDEPAEDLLSVIQDSYLQLPGRLADILSRIGDCPLSVQEAHALSQLAQTGFVGFQNITTPLVPVGTQGELIPFLETSANTVKVAQGLYEDVCLLEYYIDQLPPSIDLPDEEYNQELQAAIDEYNESSRDLYRAEQRAQTLRPFVAQVVQYGSDLLTQNMNGGTGVSMNINQNYIPQNVVNDEFSTTTANNTSKNSVKYSTDWERLCVTKPDLFYLTLGDSAPTNNATFDDDNSIQT